MKFKTAMKIAKVAATIVGLGVLAYVDLKIRQIAENMNESYEDYGDVPEGVIVEGEVIEIKDETDE